MSEKPSYQWLVGAPDNEFDATLHAIIQAMTNNPVLPNPVPVLATVIAAAETWVIALAESKDGGKLETATKNSTRKAVAGMMRKWGQYIEDTADGNLEILLASKFPLQRPRVPLGVQPPPANLRLKAGKVSGSVIARCDPSPHRVLYEWQIAIGATPGPWENQPPTNSTSTTFANFPPGTWLHVRVRVRVSAGAGDWSSVIKIMVI